ncbi:MAG: hypothetical protein WCG05_05055 [Alphaproteobacteria bacterium]
MKLKNLLTSITLVVACESFGAFNPEQLSSVPKIISTLQHTTREGRQHLQKYTQQLADLRNTSQPSLEGMMRQNKAAVQENLVNLKGTLMNEYRLLTGLVTEPSLFSGKTIRIKKAFHANLHDFYQLCHKLLSENLAVSKDATLSEKVGPVAALAKQREDFFQTVLSLYQEDVGAEKSTFLKGGVGGKLSGYLPTVVTPYLSDYLYLTESRCIDLVFLTTLPEAAEELKEASQLLWDLETTLTDKELKKVEDGYGFYTSEKLTTEKKKITGSLSPADLLEFIKSQNFALEGSSPLKPLVDELQLADATQPAPAPVEAETPTGPSEPGSQDQTPSSTQSVEASITEEKEIPAQETVPSVHPGEETGAPAQQAAPAPTAVLPAKPATFSAIAAIPPAAQADQKPQQKTHRRSPKESFMVSVSLGRK